MLILIDDEPLLRETLVSLLEDLGYAVEQAGDGSQGLQLVEAYGDDVEAVIVDLHMPVMDGFDFLEKMRQQKKLFSIIVLSGTGDSDDEERAKALGAFAVASKPIIDLGEFIQILNRAIGNLSQ